MKRISKILCAVMATCVAAFTFAACSENGIVVNFMTNEDFINANNQDGLSRIALYDGDGVRTFLTNDEVAVLAYDEEDWITINVAHDTVEVELDIFELFSKEGFNTNFTTNGFYFTRSDVTMGTTATMRQGVVYLLDEASLISGTEKWTCPALNVNTPMTKDEIKAFAGADQTMVRMYYDDIFDGGRARIYADYKTTSELKAGTTEIVFTFYCGTTIEFLNIRIEKESAPTDPIDPIIPGDDDDDTGEPEPGDGEEPINP